MNPTARITLLSSGRVLAEIAQTALLLGIVAIAFL